eukprot:8291505-Karenia_brevis.AAC.1
MVRGWFRDGLGMGLFKIYKLPESPPEAARSNPKPPEVPEIFRFGRMTKSYVPETGATTFRVNLADRCRTP